jgi:hypothetical protein
VGEHAGDHLLDGSTRAIGILGGQIFATSVTFLMVDCPRRQTLARLAPQPGIGVPGVRGATR